MRAVALKESRRVASAIPATDGGAIQPKGADRALLDLGQALREQGYRFTTITPASHRIVAARTHRRATTLRDVFGWSRSFTEDDLPAGMLLNLEQAGALERKGESLRRGVRVST